MEAGSFANIIAVKSGLMKDIAVLEHIDFVRKGEVRGAKAEEG